MKTTILASALLMSLTFSSFAQEPEKAGIKKGEAVAVRTAE